MMFETSWSDNFLMPFKRSSLRVVNRNILIDSLTYLAGRSKTSPIKRLAPEDAKPAFYLVKPRSMGRREMEGYIRMALQPTILFGFMGTQVIEYNMDFLIRVIGNDLIHKIQKLTASSAVIVASLYHTSGYIQGSKQGSRAMTLILVIDT